MIFNLRKFALLLFVISVITQPFAHSIEPDDSKPEEKRTPLFVGMWQSDEDGFFLQLSEEGSVLMHSSIGEKTGNWESGSTKGELKITHKEEDETKTFDLKFKQKDSDTLIVTEGTREKKLKRITKSLDPGYLVGRWKASYKEEDSEDHFLIIRREDGSGYSVDLFINHKKKIYAYDAGAFTWKVFGLVWTESYETDPEISESTLFKAIKIEADKIHLKNIGEGFEDDEEVTVDVRTTDLELDAPPAGYKKMLIDEYWEEVEEVDE